MNLFSYIRLKAQEYWIWAKRKVSGDMRPEAVKPPPKKRKPRKKKESV